MRLNDVLLSSAESGLSLQLRNGAFPAGHNGPYRTQDTPVRNTAHWLITLLKAFEISADQGYVDAALNAAEYLSSVEARPMNATFLCRTDPERDLANGLIGQAWAVEALVAAADALEHEGCRRLAEDVFLLHPFLEEHALWRRVNVDGSHGTIDMTFNHQLWFAAAGAMISGPHGECGRRVTRFLDRVEDAHLRLARNGRIIHALRQPSRSYGFARAVFDWHSPRSRLATRRDQLEKGIGYHAFNLYAFALLREAVPLHSLWKGEKLAKALKYVAQDEFVSGLEYNKYGYPYNPPGFEVAFAQQVFPRVAPSMRTPAMWVASQLSRSFDFDASLMTRNSADPQTLAARLYEATRLRDMPLDGLVERR